MSEHVLISSDEMHFNARPIPIGSRFAHLEVAGYVRSLSGGWSKVGYQCLCDCGKTCIKRREDLKHSHQWLSCGCIKKPQKKRGRAHNYKAINHDGNGKRRPEYSSWASMIQRCKNKRLKGWANYGGRGIKVCKRWLKFENFLADMGDRPPNTSLDRIDNNGNYEPSNCRWATDQEQAENTRAVKWFTHDGYTRTLSGWADHLGICTATLIYRINRYGYAAAIQMGGRTGSRDIKTVNRTGLRGVGKRGEKFFAQIQHRGRVLYLGRFETGEQAHQAYLSARARFDSEAR